MKTLALWPFYSQQDKATGEFLLDSDVTCQLMRSISRCWEGPIVTLLPFRSKGTMPGELRHITTPTTNAERRLHFNTHETSDALKGCDLVVVNNELIAARLKSTFRGKIIHFNHLMPIGQHSWMRERQIESWQCADLVVFLTDYLQNFALRMCSTIVTTVWPIAISDDIKVPIRPTTYDCVFPQRCSATNYTHHEEFLKAAEILPHLTFAITDPTRFLTRWPDNVHRCESLTRDGYLALLAASKMAIGLMEDDLHGGVAIREAIASGCWPILLDRPCYAELLGTKLNWPVDYWKLAAAIDGPFETSSVEERFSIHSTRIKCELASM